MAIFVDTIRLARVWAWPRVLYFAIFRVLVPRWLSRWWYSLPTEFLAMQYAIKNSKEGEPESVLAALDSYGRKNFLMNVGDVKGQLLTNVIKERQPKVVLELGAFLGYSAIAIAKNLPEGARLISVEVSAVHAALATKLVEWAGLSKKVTIVIGGSTETIPRLREKFGIDTLDVVFIDHLKTLYLKDLQELEKTGLLKPGHTVIVADNILYPGAPDYLAYVTTEPGKGPAGRTCYYKTEQHLSSLEYCEDVQDMVCVSTPL